MDINHPAGVHSFVTVLARRLRDYRARACGIPPTPPPGFAVLQRVRRALGGASFKFHACREPRRISSPKFPTASRSSDSEHRTRNLVLPRTTYPPLHLAERIRAEQVALEARGATDGERKTITALFADLKGSTALIEGLDPEEARAIIDPALQLDDGRRASL